MSRITKYWLIMFVQAVIFLILLIGVDYWRTVYYKGRDGNEHKMVDRLQLDEKPDVVEHKRFADSVWNHPEAKDA